MKCVASRHVGFAVLFWLIGIALSLMPMGCLVTSHSSETHGGNYVSDNTFAQIKPGQTTPVWVKATLGDPSKVTKMDDGTELWDYTYSEQKESSGAVFLIFGGSDTKESTGHAFVEFKNGVVTRAWRG